MSDAAAEVRDLVKRYPKRPTNAVDGISFTVRPAEVFGLLGPNGAGKTTTVGVLTTRVALTSGVALIDGIDVTRAPVAARRRLAVVPQRPNLDRSLNARQNLIFHAAYHGVPAAERNRRADALLDQFGLADRAGDKVDRMSGGQAQRLMIARALMHAPQVLFLDEPTTGLDPRSRVELWGLLEELVREGATLLLTTQYLEEADRLADDIVVLDGGRIAAQGSPAELKSRIGGERLEVTLASADELGAAALALGPFATDEPAIDVEAGRVVAPVRAGVPLTEVVRALDAAEVDTTDLHRREATLDDVFLTLTDPTMELAA